MQGHRLYNHVQMQLHFHAGACIIYDHIYLNPYIYTRIQTHGDHNRGWGAPLAAHP